MAWDEGRRPVGDRQLCLIQHFCGLQSLQNPKGNSLSADVRTRGRKNWGFSSEIAVYLGCGTRWVHGYYGSLVESHRWRIDPCWVRWPWVTLKCGTGGSIFAGSPHYAPTVSRRMTEIELVRGGKKHVFRWHHDPVSRGRGQNV